MKTAITLLALLALAFAVGRWFASLMDRAFDAWERDLTAPLPTVPEDIQ